MGSLRAFVRGGGRFPETGTIAGPRGRGTYVPVALIPVALG